MSIEIRKANENDFAITHGLIKEFAPEKISITVEQMQTRWVNYLL